MTATANPLENNTADGLDHRFARAMDRFGPFEAAPHIAVAVSGGADSMALALLAQNWTQGRGGRMTALIVDHGLRDGAAAEAAETAGRLQSLGIAAHVLAWGGDKPGAGVQAAARAARYDLLRALCRDAGVLHLLAGHQADDQAETHVMRRARGDGMGAAGMSALRVFPELRLLRPLLGVRRGDLSAYLTARGIAWIEDPSNADEGFERVRTRRRLKTDPLLADTANETVLRAGHARVALEGAVNGALADAVALHPLGFAYVDCRTVAALSCDVAVPMIQRLVQAVGGTDHAPPTARADRLFARLAADAAFSGASLGHCQFMAVKAGRIAVCRDARGLPAPTGAMPGHVMGWDGRFVIDLPQDTDPDLILAPLGADGWRQIPKGLRGFGGLTLPFARTLPALFRDGVIVAHALGDGKAALSVRFRPKNSLAFNGFCIA